MPVLGFHRIQVRCPSTRQAIDEYSILLGLQPVWQGHYELSNADINTDINTDISTNTNTPLCNGSSAWFVLENTILEFIDGGFENDGSSESKEAFIERLVLSADDVTDLIESQSTESFICLYEGDDLSFTETQLDISLGDNSLRKVTVVDASDQPCFHASAASPNFTKVDHVVLYSNHAQTCIELFSELLGMRLALDKTVPQWGGRMLFFRSGQLTLEIISPTEPFHGADYYWGIAYQTSSLDQVHQALTDQAVTVSDIRSGRKPGTRVATLKSHQLGIPTIIIEQALKL